MDLKSLRFPFLGCTVILLIVALVFGGAKVLKGHEKDPNTFKDYVYLSEIQEGQAPVTINEDGTSTVLCLEKVESTNGVPDYHYNVVVKEITNKNIVVEIGERLNYDGLTDVVVGFKTTKEISPSCLIQIKSHNLETDTYTDREFKR